LQILEYSPSGRIYKPLRHERIFYKHEHNTIEETGTLITENSGLENFPTPLKETPTHEGTDIWSAVPNLPEYYAVSVAKYLPTCRKSPVPPKRLQLFDIFSCNTWGSRRSRVGKASTLWAGRSGVWIPVGTRFIFSPKRPDRLWEPPKLLFSGYQSIFPGINKPGREVNNSPHLLPRLWVSGSLPLLQLYLFMAWTRQIYPLLYSLGLLDHEDSHYTHPKRRQLFTSRHGITSQKNSLFINTAIRTSNTRILSILRGSIRNFLWMLFWLLQASQC
jgi:hypothetical protein